MTRPPLHDPDRFPEADVLAACLGPALAALDALFALHRAEHPDLVEVWRYYRDGGSWLMNVSRKKKTVCWLSAWEGYFRVGFYFGAKAEAAVLGVGLPDDVLEAFRASAGKKLRPVSLEIRNPADLAVYRRVLEVRLATM